MEANNEIRPVVAVPPSWTEVQPDALGLWQTAGVFSITNTRSGKHFFVASACVGKRLRDNYGWLTNGVHKSHQLQEDWNQDSQSFRWFVVERTKVDWLLPTLKQIWLDKFSADGLTYNSKRAVSKKQAPRRRPTVPVVALREMLKPSAADFDGWLDRLVEGTDWGGTALSVDGSLARAEALIDVSKKLLADLRCRGGNGRAATGGILPQ
jgi:hypothetical protein